MGYENSWKILTDHDQCNCSTATKKRRIICSKLDLNDSRNSDGLEHSSCQHLIKPFNHPAPCPEDCPPSWIVFNFTECSVKCGGGIKTREVFCGNPNHESYRADVEKCLLQPEPSRTVKCADTDCEPQYSTSKWSTACHTTNVGKSCGRGVNTRDLGCQQRLADGTTVQSQHCDLKDKPSSFRDCYKPCPGDQLLNLTVFNLSRTFFVKKGQPVNLSCALDCRFPGSTFSWKINGELDKTRLSAKKDYYIDSFEPENQAGLYTCSINIPEICYSRHNKANTSPECRCQKQLNFTLIFLEDEARQIFQKAPQLSTSPETIETKSEDLNGECYRGNCSIEWITSAWPSLECYQREDNEDGEETSKSQTSNLCTKREQRLVWCGVDSPESSSVVDPSNCNPELKPEEMRDCLIEC
ncbi:protein madd-4-like isoform X2 [Symsagittifera roscoffensis]|uniref:protein madd-4-like isoform X2 n=1 Tax=Symsagittifera roscoffensis TaxID=84072 RepID=UPI00307CA384